MTDNPDTPALLDTPRQPAACSGVDTAIALASLAVALADSPAVHAAVASLVRKIVNHDHPQEAVAAAMKAVEESKESS